MIVYIYICITCIFDDYTYKTSMCVSVPSLSSCRMVSEAWKVPRDLAESHDVLCPPLMYKSKCYVWHRSLKVNQPGWWWLEHEWIIFHFICGCHPSHWRTPSFFKMRKKPPTSNWWKVVMDINGHILDLDSDLTRFHHQIASIVTAFSWSI